MSKLLVLFVYHIYNKRVKHFINNAIFEDPNIDFVVISNNGTPPEYVQPYVKVFVRQNIGFDFGGWSEALLTNNLYENYDNFIFVNSSVMGPFIYRGIFFKWTDVYLNGLKDNVKLFGSTINTCRFPGKEAHVQSYIFSMSKVTLQYLINCEIFSTKNYPKTLHEAVINKEILMSRKIIDNGWNIGSLMSQYKDVDFTFRTKQLRDYKNPWLDEIMQTQFRNVYWNEYQLVFIKGNRLNIDSTEDLKKRDLRPSSVVNRTISSIALHNKVSKIKMDRSLSPSVKKSMKPLIGIRNSIYKRI
jgi:hypothetical protein